MIDPLVIVFGLGVGVLIGLTGIGGGSLMRFAYTRARGARSAEVVTA